MATLSLDAIAAAIGSADDQALNASIPDPERQRFQNAAQLLRGDLVKLVGEQFDASSSAYQDADAAITAAATALANASTDSATITAQLTVLNNLVQALANLAKLIAPLA
jgi:hypothetical protein